MYKTNQNRRHFLKLAGAGLGATALSSPLMAGFVEPVKTVVSSKADFYVATDGDDKSVGTSVDQPFATLARARDAVKQTKSDKDITVLIRGGRYQLNETVVFGIADGRAGESTVTYAAYPGETPVFSAAKEITGWKKVTNALAGLPKEAEGNVYVADTPDTFFTLYDNEGMLPRARSEGFIPTKKGKQDLLNFPKGALKNWSNLDDVELVVRPNHAWIVNVLPLKSVDEKKHVARTKVDATYAMNPLHFLKDTESVWVENVMEGLSKPGNWVLNSEEGKVYLWPRGTTPVLAGQMRELVRIEGAIDEMGPKDTPVRNLHFRGLTFMHGDRHSITNEDAGVQHDWEMHDKDHAMFRLRGAENCVIDQCHFAHSGSSGIRVDLHGMHNKITNNHIEHVGSTGIFLCGYGPGTKYVNKENLVYNNHIHHTGRIYSHGSGILVWQSGENRVANNLIHNTPYTGLIISGCMSHFFARGGRELTRTIRWHEVGGKPRKTNRAKVLAYLHNRNNIFESNEIHHAMEVMGDGNGIYVRGAGDGNIIRRNYVHHLVAKMHMQSAIRTDGGQRGTLITENIIYKCMSQGIILKLDNDVVNNFIVDIIAPPRGYYLSLREGPTTGAAIQKNIFYSSSDKCTFIDELPAGKGRVSEDRRGRKLARSADGDTDDNIYYCAGDPSLGEKMIAKQRAGGVDENSLSVDPLFVDVDGGDFRFKPNSPALKLGIKPIDMTEIGLRKKHE